MRVREQFADFSNVVCAAAIGEQAGVTDAVEAVWQDVNEKTADELVGGEHHGLLSVATVFAIILPFEGDGIAIAGDQSAIGYRHPMGVAG